MATESSKKNIAMLSYTDKSFSIRKTLQYKLFIQVDVDGFTFCVYDPMQKKHLVLGHVPCDFSVSYDLYPEKISAIYNDIGWLSQPFASCSCIFVSRKNTLIPASYYDKETLATFLSFAYPLDEMDEVNFRISEEAKAVAVFAVPNTLAAQLYSYHHNICFFNQCIPLIGYTLRQARKQVLAINISSHIMDMAICQNGAFTFHNAFKISSATDALYYAMFVVKQLGIKTEHIQVLLSGKLTNEVMQLLRANFPKLLLSDNVYLPVEREQIIASYLLLNLHQCE